MKAFTMEVFDTIRSGGNKLHHKHAKALFDTVVSFTRCTHSSYDTCEDGGEGEGYGNGPKNHTSDKFGPKDEVS